MFGFIKKNKEPIELKILILGLDGSGKTSALYTLFFGKPFLSVAPTIGFNFETIVYKNHSFLLWDVGDIHFYRSWDPFLQVLDVMLIIVDSNDLEKLKFLKTYLEIFFKKSPKDQPLVFFFNKKYSDKPEIKVEDLIKELGLLDYKRKWFVQSGSIAKNEGIQQCLDLLIDIGKFV
jgi:GTPase SAR1 family protein